jgi:hypothetical protein
MSRSSGIAVPQKGQNFPFSTMELPQLGQVN